MIQALDITYTIICAILTVQSELLGPVLGRTLWLASTVL